MNEVAALRSEPVPSPAVSGGVVPLWATLQQDLLARSTEAAALFAQKYTDEQGAIVYDGPMDEARDGGDDFLEPFAQWPLLHLVGADNSMSERAERHLTAVTAQLERLGLAADGYELGTDWFHQGEGNQLLYHVTTALPTASAVLRARRLADLYAGDGAASYDHSRNMIRAPHTGSRGPRWGYQDGDPAVRWRPDMRRYGPPLHDVPGVRKYDDLRDAVLADRMGRAMAHRFGSGDVAVSMAATGLVLNAWLGTRDDRYAAWIVRYVDGWVERTAANGGLVPDNVGPSGVVGELHDGRWWGGLYGWHWPHGAHSVLPALAVACVAAHKVSPNGGYLDLLRSQIDRQWEMGFQGRLRQASGALAELALRRFDPDELDESVWLVPHRHGPEGWFDMLPVDLALPTLLWNLSGESRDWDRVEFAHQQSSYDWNRSRPFRTKEDAGHEEPWLNYLAGRNPHYPVDAARCALRIVEDRLDRMAADVDGPITDIHHWQLRNPVTTEHLLQTRLGAPSPIYYGGHLQSSLRIHDLDRSRDQSPLSALVTSIGRELVTVTLVNTSSTLSVHAALWAGAHAEHDVVAVADEPAGPHPHALTPVGTRGIGVELAPRASRTLRMTLSRDALPATLLSPSSPP